MTETTTPLSPAFLALEKAQMKQQQAQAGDFDSFFEIKFASDVGCVYHKSMARQCYEEGRESGRGEGLKQAQEQEEMSPEKQQ
tara:strand:- start:2729 stop:2977 length:249 start_codon:yes stop_codon:yes gene_type:complete